MYRLVALTIALVLLAPSARAAEPPFTLEQVLSSAFPSELVAAPAGGRVAWVLNARGARNVWVAEPPEYRGRQVTAFAGDEGLGIAELAWTPDAKAVVFTRGGDLDSFAAAPNAANVAELPKQAVWVATLGEEPRQLVEGHTPAVSPRGDGVAYVSGGEIWWARFDGAPRPVRIVQTKGGVHTLRWSPDGSRLAFVVGRGTHGYVGVYTLATKGLVFLDPSVDRDAEPAWSPDGSRIAFMRFPTGRVDFVFVPRREGHPWSIRVADATTGEGREVWRADAGRGSVFRNVVADSQLVWSADDRLVFPWEKDGWTHLYSIPAAGGAALLLTPGAFEVEHVSVGPGRRDLLFSSNQGDAERRHAWRVAAAGGAPVAVTSGTGIEWAPAATSDGRAVAYLASDARRPARAVVKVGSEAPRELAPEAIPAGFPAAALVEPQPVVYAAADGAPIRAQLFATPTRAGEPRRPAVVFVHGGSRRQMLLGWHYSDYYHKAYALNQYLASRGYVVLAINFRSGIGYGMEFREATNYGAAGASEFADVVGAGLYLRARPDVDPSRIGIWGGSYGGYLTALGLARASDLFAAGVDIHGVHDWNTEIPTFSPAYDPLEHPDFARRAFAASPMASLDTWRSPVLVIHGDDDRNVPFAETATLVEELRKRRVEVEQLVLPGEVHGFLRHASWLKVYGATAGFLDRRLKK